MVMFCGQVSQLVTYVQCIDLAILIKMGKNPLVKSEWFLNLLPN